jgi:hypothetical protein
MVRPEQPMMEAALAELPDAPMAQVDAQGGASTSGQSSSTSAGQSAPASVPTNASGTTSPAATATPPEDAKQKQHDEAEREVKAQEKQRLLGVMPQFQVVMNGQAVPLSGKQKWNLALHSAIDPFYIGWAFVIGGGWGEIVDSNSGYGWGPKGYFDRVGANYADNVDGAVIGNAVLPTLLHQDPRYFRMGTGSFGRRFVHAALSTVVCHGDNGKNQANVSNVLGNFVSGAISNAYYPANERGIGLTLENGLSVTLFGALGGQILEFGPDLQRLVVHKKNVSAPVGPVSDPSQAKAIDKQAKQPQAAPANLSAAPAQQ